MGKAGLELKKEILLALGKTPIITNQKLLIEPNEWFAEIQNDYPVLEKKYLRLEPTKMPMNKAKTEALASVRAHWLRRQDSNLRPTGYTSPIVAVGDGLYHDPALRDPRRFLRPIVGVLPFRIVSTPSL